MVKVIDCFTFYNELEMLDFKLRELEDVVDYFVIVEATTTYSGNNKPQYLDEKTIQQQIDNCSDLFFRTEQHCSFTKIAVEDNKYLPVHHTMLL